MARGTYTREPNLLRDIVVSLGLTANTWSMLERAGACAFCAARLVGCRETAVYACDEQDLRAQLTAHFRRPPSEGDSVPTTEPTATVPSQKTGTVSLDNDINDIGVGGGVGTPLRRQKDCCTWCLGLLQSEVPVRMTPRPRPSSGSHDDDSRPCAVAVQKHKQEAFHELAEEIRPSLATETVSLAYAAAAQTDGVSVGGADVVCPDETAATASASAAPSAASGDDLVNSSMNCRPAAIVATTNVDGVSCYRRARMAEAVADCANSRGYTITTFGMTVALPACLAVHDAAFIQAIGLGSSIAPDLANHDIHSTGPAAAAGTATSPTVISVKEALKLGLAEGLHSRLGDSGVVIDPDSDFVVEVTAKAPEADAHAKALLLGESFQPPSGRKKQPGWPGSGRWSKKRQRREEHRNQGLTVGAVKKGLLDLDGEGRARMRRWVKSLEAGRQGGNEKPQALKNHGDTEGNVRRLERESDEVEGVSCMNENMDVDTTDVENGLEDKNESGKSKNHLMKEESISGSVSVEYTAQSSIVPASNTNDLNSGSDVRVPFQAYCDIAIRRLPIHFWGRYTKLSRVVPQTPWVKGFFSVQEAVSEPFEEFSGSIEALLHGSGREDVDVRMLGNGRPFSLELVDSLRSVDEITVALPALQKAVNSGVGQRNAGGGVAVSELRVAGPGDLPSDVQRVGEGKRKHYRCVVWVSRAVGDKELKRTLCNRPELVVQQATPVRVLHRRTLMDRPRSIFDMRVDWLNDHFFVLNLTTSAGTYIKEFVHGDLGRTIPSVGSLLNCRADILQLDVVRVEDKWSTEGREGKEEERPETEGDSGLASVVATHEHR